MVKVINNKMINGTIKIINKKQITNIIMMKTLKIVLIILAKNMDWISPVKIEIKKIIIKMN